MTDPAPRQPKGWPLLAISLLVILLIGFLVVKWRRKDDGPAVVKAPPTAVEPVKASDPVKAPDPVKTADPVKPPPGDAARAAEFKQRADELSEALKEKRWDAAAAALDAARKLNADAPELKGAEEAIAEGRKKDEAERAEAARRLALKQKQDGE